MTVHSVLLWETSPLAHISLETQNRREAVVQYVAISALTECSACFGPFSNSLDPVAIVHHEGGEEHPFHKKCLFQWLAMQRQMAMQQRWKLEQVCPICRKDLSFVAKNRGKAVIKAVQRRETSRLIQLLLDGDISIEDRDHALFVALNWGQRFHAIRALLQSGPISKAARGKALIQEINKGEYAEFFELFNSGPISQGDAGRAVIAAVRKCHRSMAEMLLKRYDILEEHLSKAELAAAKVNDPAIFRMLANYT